MKVLKESDKLATKLAVQVLNNDGIICFATETVYALACNAASDAAVQKLYQLKKRDENKPIAIFASNLKTAKKILKFNKAEEKIAEKFMPGMITLILKQQALKKQKIKVSKLLNNKDKTLGLRIPNHEFCLKLLLEFNGIIAATSANTSSEPAATDFEQANKYFKNKIDLMIDGGICHHKIASTIIKIENKKIKIIREGLITKKQLDNE